ncbi:hypothetical protein JXA63_01025 [Candidatus Woesebacteria bacterium]|nr:hypothetical protein [Candidatus Woesebacteria bacterium]
MSSFIERASIVYPPGNEKDESSSCCKTPEQILAESLGVRTNNLWSNGVSHQSGQSKERRSIHNLPDNVRVEHFINKSSRFSHSDPVEDHDRRRKMRRGH